MEEGNLWVTSKTFQKIGETPRGRCSKHKTTKSTHGGKETPPPAQSVSKGALPKPMDEGFLLGMNFDWGHVGGPHLHGDAYPTIVEGDSH